MFDFSIITTAAACDADIDAANGATTEPPPPPLAAAPLDALKAAAKNLASAIAPQDAKAALEVHLGLGDTWAVARVGIVAKDADNA